VSLYLLDSTVLIDFLRGRPAIKRVAALRDAGDVPATTGINVDEIVRGLRPGEEPAARSLFEGLVVLPIGRRVGWRGGEWRREFAARGITLYQADCLIAGAAWVHKAVLVTGNPKDFPMNDVTVEHWPVGS
jgi:predicted nucleic acid-binding protein